MKLAYFLVPIALALAATMVPESTLNLKEAAMVSSLVGAWLISKFGLKLL